MNDVQWLDEHQEQAWRALHFMHTRLSAALAHQLHVDSGLSYSDYMVLVSLTDKPEGRVRPYELGEELAWEKSRLSHHIRRMADRGLVTRAKCADDGRGSFIVITGKGRAEIEAAAPGHVDAVRRLFVDQLSVAQLAALKDAADTVLAGLDGVCEQRAAQDDS